MQASNPPVVPADTEPTAWRTQMRALAAMTPQQRLDEWAQLNAELSAMAEAAVRRRHPDFDDRRVMLALARVRLGDELFRAAWPDEDLPAP